jgi:hypothetical protein
MTEIVAQTNSRTGSVHEATAEIRYTKSIDETGWLMIRIDGAGNVSVPEYMKVVLTVKRDRNGKPTNENNERQFFVVMEGAYKGKMGSLSKGNAAKCLVRATRGNGARLVVKIIGRKRERSAPRGGEELNQLWAELSFDGQKARITLDSLDSENPPYRTYRETNSTSPYYGQDRKAVPLQKGTYKILTPEVAHPKEYTSFYRTEPGGFPGLRYDTVWFQLENPATQNSNFVHVGNLSEGCVTVYQLEEWNPLYKYLISNRIDKDAKYVGTITIE